MAKSKGGGILARTARKAKGLAKKAASRARRGVKAAGTPNREVPPPTDRPSVQGGAKKAKGAAKRATTKAKNTTKKTVKKAQAQTQRTAKTVTRATTSARAPAAGRRTPSVDASGPVHSSGSKGAARKAPGGPPRGGKR